MQQRRKYPIWHNRSYTSNRANLRPRLLQICFPVISIIMGLSIQLQDTGARPQIKVSLSHYVFPEDIVAKLKVKTGLVLRTSVAESFVARR